MRTKGFYSYQRSRLYHKKALKLGWLKKELLILLLFWDEILPTSAPIHYTVCNSCKSWLYSELYATISLYGTQYELLYAHGQIIGQMNGLTNSYQIQNSMEVCPRSEGGFNRKKNRKMNLSTVLAMKLHEANPHTNRLQPAIVNYKTYFYKILSESFRKFLDSTIHSPLCCFADLCFHELNI